MIPVEFKSSAVTQLVAAPLLCAADIESLVLLRSFQAVNSLLNKYMSYDERLKARLSIVDDHIRYENSHNLDAVMATFGTDARYDDEPWRDHRAGRDGVRAYYVELMKALPDLEIEVTQQHESLESVVVEVIIRGTHRGPWRGLPATGRRIEFPLCGIYTFGADNLLAGERIYYDRGMVLSQLGMFHEPAKGWQRLATAISHPVTIARAILRSRHQ